MTTLDGEQATVSMITERYFPSDWEVIDSERTEYTPGYGKTTYTCRCKRCGKIGTQWEED